MFNSTSRIHSNVVISQNGVGSGEVIVLNDGEHDLEGLAHTIYLDPFRYSTLCLIYSLFFSLSLFLSLCFIATAGLHKLELRDRES